MGKEWGNDCMEIKTFGELIDWTRDLHQNLARCLRHCATLHDQIIELYKTLIGKAEIPEAKELLESLLTMEQNESMRLARQIGRMEDL